VISTRRFWFFYLSTLLAAVIFAASAGATGFGLEILGNGQTWNYNSTDLGCSDPGEGTKSQCTGSGLVVSAGLLRLDSWSISLDGDPVISGPIAVTNLSGSTQQFTFTFTLPTVTGPSTLTGGSVQGGMTDNNGDGVTLSTASGSAFYTPMIDGGAFGPGILYADPQSFSAGGFLSGNVPNLAFGTPIPSQPGPAVATSIGIKLDFLLTKQDSATFSSVFVVQPVPEPGTAALLGLGLLTLGIRSRRR